MKIHANCGFLDSASCFLSASNHNLLIYLFSCRRAFDHREILYDTKVFNIYGNLEELLFNIHQP
jgi:hypothetical protein